MEAFLVSIGVIALGEMGDKTQLLALLLAAKFRRPIPIVLGIAAATLVNHAAAGAVGGWVAAALGPPVLRWVVGLSFLGMAAWTLIPDQIDAQQSLGGRFGVFGTTVIAFFLAEMGDKTQIATVALAALLPEPRRGGGARPGLGMLLVDGPVVFLGDKLARKVPMRLVHGIAAAIFVLLGLLTLSGAGRLP